jgi:hypothetical protein
LTPISTPAGFHTRGYADILCPLPFLDVVKTRHMHPLDGADGRAAAGASDRGGADGSTYCLTTICLACHVALPPSPASEQAAVTVPRAQKQAHRLCLCDVLCLPAAATHVSRSLPESLQDAHTFCVRAVSALFTVSNFKILLRYITLR